MKRFSLSFAALVASFLSIAPLANAVTVTVTQDPNRDLCANEQVKLTLAPDDDGNYTYKWSWTDYLGVTQTRDGSSLSDFPMRTTEYSYHVYDELNTLVATGSQTVNVSTAPTVTVDKSAAYVLSGGDVSITATGSTGTASYEWFDASGISVGTNQTLSLTNVTADAKYSVVAKGANGCTSKAVTVNVYIYTVTADPTTVCYGEAVTLTASAATGSKFYWDDGAEGQTHVVYPKGTPKTKYTVTIKDASDALVATQEIEVNVIAKPIVTLTPSESTICKGQTVTIIATNNTGNTGTYTWSSVDGKGNSLVISPTTSTTYWAEFTDATTGCRSEKTYCTITVNPASVTSINGASKTCAGSPVTLTVSGGTPKRWFDESGTTLSTSASFDYTPTTVGDNIIYCEASDANGCSVVAQKTITVEPALTPTIYGDLAICAGGSATLSVSTEDATYLWSTNQNTKSITVSPTADATYSVTVTKNGCTATVSQTVKVNTKPTISFTGGTTICQGSTASITAAAMGGSAPYTYAWNDPASTTSATLNVAPTATTDYTVTVTDANGCTSEKTVTIVVESEIAPTISGPTTVCKETDFTLLVSDGDSFAWDDDKSSTTASIKTKLTTDRTFTVTVKKGSCSYTLQHTVTVLDGPTGEISGLLAICQGGSTRLTAPVGESYVWSPNGETTQYIDVTAAGTYSVGVTKNGCTITRSATVTVNTPTAASITAANGTTLCPNAAVGLPLKASDGKSWKWSPTGETSQEITAKPTSTTLYSVTVTDANGCESTASQLITVAPEPTNLDLTASKTTACVGDAITLTVVNAPTGSTIKSSDGTVSGNVITITASVSKQVTVTVTDLSGCTYTLIKNITVLDTPTGEITGGLSFCQGGSTVLAAPVAPASQTYTYLWNTGETTRTITVSTAGKYSVTISNGSCSAKLPEVTVTQSTPTVPTITASKTTICAGEVITLTASNYGTITQWSDGVQNLGTAATIQVSPTATTTYELTVTDAKGCTAKAYQQIVVNTPISITLTGDNSVCEGGTITVTASGAPSGSTYTWTKTGTLSNGGATLTFTPSVSETAVSVTVTPTTGCGTTQTHTFTVTPQPTGEITGITSVCSGGSTTLYAPAGETGTTYLWNNGEKTQSITTPALYKNTEYSVQIVYPNGCKLSPTPVTVTVNSTPTGTITASSDIVCVGNEVTFEANVAGATAWAWSNGTSGTNKISVTPTTIGNVQYYVDVTANGCTGRIYKTITVVDKPTAAIDKAASTNTFCEGEQVTIVATGGVRYAMNGTTSTTGVFTATPTATTTYTISVFNANDCESVVTHTVTKLTPTSEPTITADGSLNLCVGDTRTLTLNNGTIVSWGDGSNLPNYRYTAVSGDIGTKTITANVLDDKGCQKTISTTLTISAVPTVAITASNKTICKGESTTLTATAGLKSYAWESGEATNEITVSPTTNTTYRVTATNEGGCSATAEITITVLTPEVVSISGPTTACVGETVELTAVGGTKWSWSHGLGNKNTAEILAGSTTTYTCEITDANGCTSTASHTLTVNTVDVPTISGNLNVCKGLNTTLTASSADTYEWKQGTTVLGTSQTLNLTNVQTSSDYTLTITKNGCSASRTVRVTACELPTDAKITGPDKVCAGESITLTANGSGTYKWSTGEETNTITVTPTADNHTYQLTLTDINGCTQTVQKNITVNAKPSVTIDGDDEVCAGKSATLTAYGSGAFLWDDGTTISATRTIMPTVTRSYTVTLIDGNGCTATASKTVTVKTLAAPTIAATKTDICKGDEVTLTASGATGVTFEWPDLGRTGASVTVRPTATTTYKVTATNAAGCTADGYITINVHEQPTVTVTVDPLSAAICSGETATITIKGGTEYTCGGVTNTSGIFNVSPTTTTPYNIVVKNAAGCVTTTSQTITVYDKPIVSISGPTTACVGEDVTLTAVGGTKWSWSHGLGVGNTATVTAGSTTTYTCEITDANGCTSTASHTLTVNTVDVPTITGNLNVCKGLNTTLTASSADTYEWKQGTTVLGTSQTLNLTNVQTSSDYTLTITKNGCSASRTVRVTACELPTDAKITGPDKVCAGESITLTANGSGTYKWSTGEETNTITVTPTADNHTYQLTLTDINGCTQTVQKNITVNAKPSVTIDGDDEVCAGKSATLTAYGSGAFLWDDGTTISATRTIMPTVTRSYTVTLIDGNGCTATASKTVTVKTLAAPTIAATKTDICKGDEVTLTASGATGVTFEWPDLGRTGASVTVRPTATTTYKVTATNAAGCTADGYITINVHEQPTVTVTVDPLSAAICSGETATITIKGGTEYTCGGVTNTSGIFNVSPTTTTPYNIVVKNAAGCVTTTSQTITVYDKPTVSVSGDKSACVGETVELTATGGTSYEWSNGMTSQTATYTVTGTGQMSVWVKGKNANGCWSDPVTHTITINQKPTIAISGTMDICIGNQTTLTASGASTYIWSWLGGTATGNTLTVTPTTNTVYTVEGTDANGCKNSTSATVNVYLEPVVAITGPTEVCEDGEITLTATGTGTFAWNTGATEASIKVSKAGTYSVTLTGEGGCTATATHTVKTKSIVAKINNLIDGTTTICAGESVALTATGGNEYLWDNSFGTAAGITVSPATTTTYWVKVTDNISGCSKRVSHTVKVLPEPTLSFVGETTICHGSTATITVSGAKDYVWADGIGTGATITVSPTANTTYTVTATDANGCKTTQTVTVTVTPLPVAAITANKTEICVGDQVTLTASGGDTYKWGDGTTSASITVTPSETTEYTVIAYKNGCKSAQVAKTITVNPLPNVAITASATTVCKGENVTLTATGATTYVWSNGATTQSITVPVTSDITYTVTGKKNGCESTASQTITVNTPPTINISSNTGKLAICKGESITLTASGAANYTWANGLGDNQASITVNPTADTYYEVTGTDANGCKSTANVTVKVYEKPNPTISGATEICEGSYTTLTVNDPNAVAWQWNTGAATQSIDVYQKGTYTVKVTGQGGCTETATAIVTYLTPVSGSIAGPDKVCKGETVTLTANGGKTYKWDDNAYESEKLVITNIQTTGTYWVTITGTNGCTQRLSHTVYVNDAPSVSITGSLTFCEGGSTQLTAVGDGTVLWSTGSTDKTITVNAEGTYEVTLTDANGCQATTSVTVKRNALPVAVITGDNAVCEGKSVTLTVSGAESYTWSTGATGSSITVQPVTTTTYTVTPRTGTCVGDPVSHTVTVNPKPVITFDGDFEICAGEKAVITADGADTYTWGDGTTGATYTTAALNANTTFTVTGRITATGCEAQAQVTVIVNPKPTIFISGDKEVCAGSSATLTVWPNGGTYVWSNGSKERTATFNNLISDQDYWVDVTLPNGCTDRYNGTIKVNPIPQATITTNTGVTTVCSGDPITLTASGGATGTYTYLWAHDGSRSASVTVTPTADTKYTVTVIGAGNCQATATVDIKVLALPIAKITADKTTVCEGDEVTLSASDGVKWQWYVGNTEIAGAVDQHYTITNAAYGTTTYKVSVYNANNCKIETTYALAVGRKPDATISGNLNICKGSSTTLSAPTADSYLWSTGETTKTITVAPSATKDYGVTVTVGDCKASSTVTVTVNALPAPVLTADDAEICVGNSTTLRAGAGYTYYKWSTTKDGVIKEGTNLQSIGVSPTEKTTYTVTVTDANGCTGSAQTTVDVTQVAAPTITASATTVCAGSEVVLQSSAAKYYQWSSNVDVTQQKQQTVTVYPTQTTVYTVTTTNKAGCQSSKDITINVTKLPTPKITGTSNMCKGGDGVTLTATSDVDGATYTWSTGETGNAITVKPSKKTEYRVWASNGTCKNPTPATFTVDINDLPAAQINGPDAVCLGGSVELEATGGISYLWQNIEGAASTLSKITVTPTQTTTYTVTVTDANGCSKDVSKKVTVNDLPKPAITGTAKVCRGESVTLTASGGNTYLWATGETTKQITVTPALTTTYTVEATNANGCTSEAEFTVQVVQLPKAHIDGPTVLCAETATTLTVVSDDGRTYTCRWKHNNSTNLAETVKPINTTTYTVEVFDGTCSTTLDHTITVNKLEDPKIDGPAQICLGESTTLRVSNVPNNFVSYQWVETGETTQEITVTPAVVGMSTYTVICTDVHECTSEATIDIVVSALPDVTVTASTDVLCAGDNSVTLTASGAGMGGTYNWYEDDLGTVLLPGGDGTPTYTFNNLDYTQKVYVVAITRLGCKSAPKEYELVVTPKPTPTITSSVPVNIICDGGSIELTASDPDPDVTFVWEDGTTGAHLKVTAEGEYRVTAINKAGCAQDATITITPEPLPAAKITPSIIAGEGAGDGTKICAGTRVTLTAEPESTSTLTYTYKWNTGSTERAIVVNPTAITTYGVTVTSASGCEQTATITIEVNNFVTIEGPTEVCAGKPYVLNATGNNLSAYKWTRNGEPLPAFDSLASIQTTDEVPNGQPSAEYVYTVNALYANTCESEATFTVTVYAKPSDLTINGIAGANATDSVCVGSAKQLSVIPTAGSSLTGATYLWTGVGITDPTAATQTITPTVVGEEPYSCQITMPGGCDTTVNVKLKAVPLPELALCTDTTICFGTEATLYLKAKNNCPEGTTITWTSDNGGGGASGDVVTVSPTTTTTYTVTAKTPAPLGCSTTETVTVTVIPQQQPTITLAPELICLDAKGVSEDDLKLITANTDSEGRPFKDYKWYAADDPTIILGMADAITVPKANITATRTYIVEVTTQEGCTASHSVEVPVSEKPSVAIKGDGQVCEGQSLQLQADNPVNVAHYEWTTNDNPTPFATTSSVTVSPTVAEDTYYLTVYNDKGCAFTVNPGHKVTILDAPKPQIAADHNPICEGDDVVLTASDLAGGTCSVVWDDGSTNPTRTIKALTATTTYSVALTNQNNCVEKVEYTVTVNPLPKLKITGNTQVCVGDSVLLSVEDANGTANTYSWTGGTWKEATDRGSVNNSKVWVYPTNTADSTAYCVTSVDANTCKGKEVCHKILAFAKPIAKINGKQMATDTICVGESLILEATGGTKFKWSTTAESQQITTPIYNSVNTYTYWVDVYNEANCVERDSIWIYVAARPNAYIASVTPGNQICEGTEVTLRASDAPTGSTYTYAWVNNTGATIDNANQQEISVKPAVNTTYTLTVTDVKTGCTQEVQQIIYVNPQAKVNFGTAPTTICETDGFALTIEGDVTGQTIVWEKLRNGTVVDVSAWNGRTSITDKPDAAPYIYRATLTNQTTGCQTVLEHTLIVVRVPKPSIQILGTTTDTICQGVEVTLRANNDEGRFAAGDVNFVWKVGHDTISTSVNQKEITVKPRETTIYTLAIEDLTNHCIDKYDTVIVVNQIPQVSIVEPDNQVICEDEPFTLTLQGADGYGISWQKYDNGTLVPGWTKNGVNTITDYPIKSQYEYRVTIDNGKCDTTIVRKLRVNAVPKPSITFPGSNKDTICAGQEVWLAATTEEGNWSTLYYTYGWLHDTDTLTKNNKDLKITPTTTETYTFYMIDNNSGCRRTADTTVVVRAMPQVEVNTPNEQLCEGKTYTLEMTGLSSTTPLSDYTIVWTKYDNFNNKLGEQTGGATYSDTPTEGEYIYYAKATNFKCDTIITRKLKVSAVPEPKIDLASGTTETICEGDQVALYGQNSTGNYNFTDYPMTWYATTKDGNDTIILKNNQLATHFPQQTTTYKLVIANAMGCERSVTKTITVKPRPAVKLQVNGRDAAAQDTICRGETLDLQIVDTLYNTVDGLSVQWKRNGTVVGEWADQFVIRNYEPQVYESYEITVKNAECPIVLNYDLTVNYLPDPTLEIRNGVRVNCAGTPVELGGKLPQEADYNYLWTSIPAGEVFTDSTQQTLTVYPTSSTTYYYTVTDPKTGCSRSDSIAITVNKRPNVTLAVVYPEGAVGSICQTDSVTLRLVGDTDGLTTLWYKGGNSMADWADKLAVKDAPDATTDYSVTVMNALCDLKLDTQIVVSPVQSPKIYSVGDITTICEGKGVELKAQEAQEPLKYDYMWTSSNVNEKIENPTLGNITVNPTITTTYTYTVTNKLTTCSRSDTLRITVNLLPKATLEVKYPTTVRDDGTICAGDPFTLNVNTTEAYELTTKWWANEGEVPDWENKTSIPNVTGNETTRYKVEVRRKGYDCPITLEKEVKMLFVPDPTIEITEGGSPMCEGSDLTIAAKGKTQDAATFTYRWESSVTGELDAYGNAVNGQSGLQIYVKPKENTTYSYTITDPITSCSRTGQITITVNKKPNVRLVTGSNTLAKDTLICGGQPVEFRVDGTLDGLSFEWYKDDIQQPNNTARYTDTPEKDAKYYVIVTNNATGCATVKEDLMATVTVNNMPVPSIEIEGGTNIVCAGTTVTLKATEDQPHDAVTYRYLWYAEGKSMGSAQELKVTPTVTTTYMYTVLNKTTKCLRSVDTTIVVKQIPQVTLEKSLADDAIYCAGDPITLSVKPLDGTNANDLQYEWLRNGVALSETSATLTDRPMGSVGNENDTIYNYEVVVKDKSSLCSADPTNLKFTVTVKPLPVPTIVAFDNANNPLTLGQQVCPNRLIRLQGTALSGKLFSYKWYSQNQDDADITVTDKPNEVWVSPSSKTKYTLEIKNLETGCTRFATYTIDVMATPRIKIVSSATIDSETGYSVACLNSTPDITLKVAQEDGTVIDDLYYNITWNDEAGNDLGDLAELTLGTDAVSIHKYTVTVENTTTLWSDLQCPVTATHTVQIMDAPTSVTIAATTSDGTLLPDDEYICAGEAVTLTAAEQTRTNYAWSDDQGTVYAANADNNAREITVKPLKTTTYYVKVTNFGGCVHTVKRTILVNPNPVVRIDGATSLCLETAGGDTVTLTATSTPYEKNNTRFVWNYEVDGAANTFTGNPLKFAPQKAGEFKFTVTAYHTANKKECASTPVTHTVRVYAVPEVRNSDLRVVSSLDSTASACIDTKFEIEATAGYTRYVFGEYDRTNSKAKEMQNSTSNIFSSTQSSDGEWEYYCDFYNDAGCSRRIFIDVTVNKKPSGATITPTGGDFTGYNTKTNPPEATICQGKEITLTGSATGDNRYSWRDTDGQTYSGQAIAVKPTSTTTYTLTVTNLSGCSVTSNFTVKVVPMDKLTVTANGTTDSLAICAGSTSKVTLRVTGSSESTYNWYCQETGEKQSNKPSAIQINAPTESQTWYVEAASSANKSYGTDCKSIGSVKIHVLPNPDNKGGEIVVNDGKRDVCAGATVTLTGKHDDAVTYRWSTGEVKPAITVLIPNYEHDTTITYWAIGRNALNCENTSDTIKVDLRVKPQPEPMVGDTICYEQQTIRLEAKDKTLSYTWYDENGREVSRKYFYEFKRDTAGIYNCKLTAMNDAGCETTITVSVTVQEFKPVVLGLAFVCSGQSAKLWVDGCSLIGGYQFTWTYAGNVISQEDTVNVAQLGTYFVDVLTPWGIVGSGQMTVAQSITPGVKFSTPPPSCRGDRHALLPFTITGGMPTLYTLDFSDEALAVGFQNVVDGAISSDQIYIDLPSNVPTGIYKVRVSLTNGNGCESGFYDLSFSVGEDMVEEIWDDVLICNDQNNEFVIYQWYKNGERITGAQSQYYSELGGFSGDYYVVAYRNANSSVTSCVKSYDNKQSVAISPNPLKRHQTLRVVLPFSTDVLFGSRLEIVDAIGRTLYTNDKVEAENGIVIDYPAGVYMVRISMQSGEVITEKFVVQ